MPGELRIHRSLPHTFFSFPIWHQIPEVRQPILHDLPRPPTTSHDLP